MASFGKGIRIKVGTDFSNFKKEMDAGIGAARASGAAISQALGNITVGKGVGNELAGLVRQINNAAMASQALKADFSKADGQLREIAKAAGLSGDKFSELGQKMMKAQSSRDLEKSLDKLRKATGLSDAELRRFGKTLGLTSAQMDALKKSTDGGADKLTAFATKTAGIVGAIKSLSGFKNVSSMMLDMESRIANAVGSLSQVEPVMNKITSIAKNTGSSLESISEIFLRNSTSFNDLGYSIKNQLGFVEALTNGLVASGAKAERMDAVINALGRSMAVGVLRGRDWNTVLGSGGRVVQALADGLGVSVIKLREMAGAGQLTSDKVFKALASQADQLREEVEKMPFTINDALTNTNTSIAGMIRGFDKAFNVSNKVVKSIGLIAVALDSIGREFKELSVGSKTFFTGVELEAKEFFKNINDLSDGALGKVAQGFKGLFSDVKSEGGGLLRTAARFFDSIAALLYSFSNKAASVLAGIVDIAEEVAQAIKVGFGKAMQGAVNNMIKPINALRGALKMEPIEIEIGLAQEREADVSGAIARMKENWAGAYEDAFKVISESGIEATFFSEVIDKLDEISDKSGPKVAQALDEIGKKGKKSANELNSLLNSLNPLRAASEELAKGQAILDKAMQAGKITAADYANYMTLLQKRFKKAAEEADKTAEQIRLANEFQKEYLEVVGRSAEAEKISLDMRIANWQDYAKTIDDVIEKQKILGQIGEMSAKLQERIDGKEWAGGKQGFKDYFDSVSNGYIQMQDFAASSMRNIEDSLVNAFTTGKLSFSDMVNSILADFTRMAARMAISNIFTSFGFGAKPNALGNIYPANTGLSAFRNRVVSQPTFFAFAKGAGLMGEAGAEAIMPLTRTPSGELGVKAPEGGGGQTITINTTYVVSSEVQKDSFRKAKRQMDEDLIQRIQKMGM